MCFRVPEPGRPYRNRRPIWGRDDDRTVRRRRRRRNTRGPPFARQRDRQGAASQATWRRDVTWRTRPGARARARPGPTAPASDANGGRMTCRKRRRAGKSPRTGDGERARAFLSWKHQQHGPPAAVRQGCTAGWRRGKTNRGRAFRGRESHSLTQRSFCR